MTYRPSTYERPEWEKCIRRTHADHLLKAWCGRSIGCEWAFTDIDHAAHTATAEDRLVPCRHCLVAIVKALYTQDGGAMSEELFARYQRCVTRLLDMFDGDPIPKANPAHSCVERLEALIDEDLIGPRVARATDANKDSWPYKKARDMLKESGTPHTPRAIGLAILALCEEVSLVSGDISHEIGGLRDELRALRQDQRSRQMSPKLLELRVPYICDACGASFVREYNDEVPTRTVECPLCGEEARVGNPLQGLREEVIALRADVAALREELHPHRSNTG